MKRYIIRRVSYCLLSLFLLSLTIFFFVRVTGDPATLLIGIPSGILASVQVGRFWDGAGKLFALLGLSLPSFLVGLVLILVFSVYLGWLPSSGAGVGWNICVPFTNICGSAEPTHLIM